MTKKILYVALAFCLMSGNLSYGQNVKPAVTEIKYGKHNDKSRIVVVLSEECKGECGYSLSSSKNNGIFALSIKGVSYKPINPNGNFGKEIQHIVIQSKEDGIDIIGRLTEQGGKINAPFILNNPSRIVLDVLGKDSTDIPSPKIIVKQVRYGTPEDNPSRFRIVVELSEKCTNDKLSGCSYSLSKKADGEFSFNVKGVSYKAAPPKGKYGEEFKNVKIKPTSDGLNISGKLTAKIGEILDPFILPYNPNLIILDILSKDSSEVPSTGTKEKKSESGKSAQKGTKNNAEKQKNDVPKTNSAAQKEQKGQIKKWVLKVSTESIKNSIEEDAKRGVHITAHWAGGATLRKKMINNIKGTVLNTVVIALKEMNGEVYINGVEKAKKYNSYYAAIPDPEKMVQDFKDAGLYTIGRIVLFKDDILPVKRPDLAVKTPSGSTWKDKKGKMWADQYSKEVWDYNIDVALRAVEAGFDEIQFDYVRYPTEGKISDCRYSQQGHNWDKGRANLAEFIRYAREKIPDDIPISIDVFGLTLSSDINEIGQDLPLLTQYANYVYPMMYPSHYYPGNYGLKNPNANPYKVIDRGLSDAMARLEYSYNKIRPYLQDFSKYGPHEVGEQIRALRKNYLRSWIMWSPNNKYTWSAYKPEYYKKNIDPEYEP